LCVEHPCGVEFLLKFIAFAQEGDPVVRNADDAVGDDRTGRMMAPLTAKSKRINPFFLLCG
jgi:hypothetical protein